jgi:hypothetical protein
MPRKPFSEHKRKLLIGLILFFVSAFGIVLTIVAILSVELVAMCGGIWSCHLR